MKSTSRPDVVRQQCVDEDLEVGANGVGGDTSLAGDVRVVDGLTVAQRGRLEDALERGEVACQRLGKNFLREVVAGIRLKRLACIVREVVRRKQTVIQGAIEIEVADLADDAVKHVFVQYRCMIY